MMMMMIKMMMKIVVKLVLKDEDGGIDRSIEGSGWIVLREGIVGECGWDLRGKGGWSKAKYGGPFDFATPRHF